ncbi:MAG: hypothetical protein JSV65_10425 [Armatimonadota bacterium]|nr:MAG: hypothetical protein JSV65_10425 [Armatimonadota bacterium]
MERVVAPGRGYHAALTLVSDGTEQALVKDYSGSGPLFRLVAAPWLAAREARIYRRLAGTRGVPRSYGRWGRTGVLLEYVDGRNCQEVAQGEVGSCFFDRLREVVSAIHGRGVAHCDLKTADNIVVTPTGEPIIVDFAQAIRRPARWNLLAQAIYQRFERDDWLALSKLKARLAPGLLTEVEIRALRWRSPAERFVRAVRDRLRALSQWAFEADARVSRAQERTRERGASARVLARK